jgi:glycerol-3-phosphate dehydrogenase
MRTMAFLQVPAVLLFLFAVAKTTAEQVVHTDVAIIGGGASGAHAAFRLQEDFGKSVVLIEKQSILVR